MPHQPPSLTWEFLGGGDAFTHEHGLTREQCETRDALSCFSPRYYSSGVHVSIYHKEDTFENHDIKCKKVPASGNLISGIVFGIA
jgi:hypothetical protein